MYQDLILYNNLQSVAFPSFQSSLFFIFIDIQVQPLTSLSSIRNFKRFGTYSKELKIYQRARQI